MGKHRNRPARVRHHRRQRSAPGQAAAAAQSLLAQLPIQSSRSAPILKKLVSSDVAERAWAATALSHLVQDTANRRHLVAAGLYPALLPLLSDSDLSVVASVLGTIQNALIAAEDNDNDGDHNDVEVLMQAGALEPLAQCFFAIVGLVRNALGVNPPVAVAAEAPNQPHTASVNDVDVVDASKPQRLDDTAAASAQPSPFELAELALGVMWTLAESSNTVLKLLSTDTVVSFIMTLIDPSHASTIPFTLVTVAAQLLNTLTDHNTDIHPAFITTPSYAECLMAYVSGSIPGFSTWEANRFSLRILSASILVNLRDAVIGSGDDTNHRISMFLARVLGAVSDALDMDVGSAMSAVLDAGRAVDEAMARRAATSSEQPVAADADTPDAETMAKTLPKPSSNLLDTMHPLENKHTQHMAAFEIQCETLQLALELLTNIYSDDAREGEDDECVVGEDDGMDAEESLNQDGDDNGDGQDMDMMVAETDDDAHGMQPLFASLSAALLELPTHLLPKLVRIAVTRLPAPSESPVSAITALDHARTVQTRAFACLSNMAIGGFLSQWALASPDDLARLWDAVFHLAVAEADGLGSSTSPSPTTTATTTITTKNAYVYTMERLESAVSVLWSLANQIAGKSTSIPPSHHYIDFLLNATSPTSPAPPSLRAKGIGALSYFARLPSNIDVNATIGTAFIAQLATQDAPEVQLEILNNLFDIYADAAFDYDAPVFTQYGFLDKLKRVAPVLRQRFRSVYRKSGRAMREYSDEVIVNLNAFIRYKSNERK